MRAARYAARLGFSLEPGTDAAARAAAPSLDIGSARVAGELRRLLEEPEAVEALRVLALLGVPWIGEYTGIPAVDAALGLPQAPDVPPWAARLGVAVTPSAAERAALPGWAVATARELRRGMAAAGALGEATRASAADRALRSLRPAAVLGALTVGGPVVGRWWERDRDRAIAIDGSDLVRAGVAPGPAIGRALTEVRAALLDGEVAEAFDDQLALALRRRAGGPVSLDLIRIATDAPAQAAFTTRRGGVSAGRFATLQPGLGQATTRTTTSGRTGWRSARSSGSTPTGSRRTGRCTGRASGGSRSTPDPGLFAGALRGWPDADALVTRGAGTGLVVLGADCLPVLLWRRDAPGVAAAHAGWRGLVAGVLEAAARSLGETARIGAAIGPGIGPCCYPVSADVRDAFARRFGDTVAGGGGGGPGGGGPGRPRRRGRARRRRSRPWRPAPRASRSASSRTAATGVRAAGRRASSGRRADGRRTPCAR